MHAPSLRPLLLSMVVAVAGYRPTPTAPPEAAPATVPVSHPVQRAVTETVEYTGRTDAVESVGIRARVTGYLTQAPF